MGPVAVRIRVSGRPITQSRLRVKRSRCQACGVLCGPVLTCALFPPQPSDFSVSLKASGKNKHFKVQLVDSVYCIGQRRFPTMDELVEHYKKAPIFTSEHGEKLYLVRALQ